MKNLLILPFLFLLFATSACAQETTEYLLSSHVLDITEGLPASGVPIKLEKLDETTNEWTLVAEKSTNESGRVNDFLPKETAELGTYRFTFMVEDYFERKQTETFYPFIEVVFRLDESKHYHVPITLSAFGYSTYRGS
ncbi:hydroxyisourate hydrolase [Neolewinella antarctica]|uniref:5-hydroxyisourate hydrolase n=1 Tax=Neolewinella antarctica TaxID=442734 RepID=A0ABX0XD92_9BACT|nr:hydroxyisourate hydrolase [Neolewinella antarctica]NJC26778.1 5-hydroxyisourate hydrolase [Neolewinella antarctica]